MDSLIFTLKDVIYLFGFAVTILGSLFTIRLLTERNKIEVQNLKERFKEEINKTNTTHSELGDLKALLMEIKGELKSMITKKN